MRFWRSGERGDNPIFWDSSAILAVLVNEPRSRALRQALRSDDRLVVWWSTPVECMSAIARGERAGEFGANQVEQARARLEVLREDWIEISASREVRDTAEALLLRHPLRAADALQLAAALAWSRGRVRGRPLMTLDQRVADAARREGFRLA